jgi:lipopolysaccharide/colanic/teichoic acid biosynthesis glycosyltransferase
MSRISHPEWVSLDMHYIRNCTIWLDSQFPLFRTPPALVNGRGVY